MPHREIVEGILFPSRKDVVHHYIYFLIGGISGMEDTETSLLRPS